MMLTGRTHPKLSLMAMFLAALAVNLLLAAPARSTGLIRIGGEPAGARGGVAAGKNDAYLPPGKFTGSIAKMKDGGGFVWDVCYNASLNAGTKVLAGYELDINDSIFNPRERPGTLSNVVREVAFGPARVSGLDLYRRVRVYKDRSLARWLDVYTNPSNRPVTVRLRSYTAVANGIKRVVVSQGGNLPPTKAAALIAISAGADPAAPHVLLVNSDGRGKLPTKVDIKGNTINARSTLTVPAGKTVILCHFKSLGKEADLKRMLNGWETAPLMKDLSEKVRRLIVNMNGMGSGGPYLHRSDRADSVLLSDGKSLFGAIENKSFKLTGTLVGRLELPAVDVVGLASCKDGLAWLTLADGQVILGKPAGLKLRLKIGEGGTLTIPHDKIKQWSFRTTKARPADRQIPGAHIRLRSGERLAVNAADMALKFRTQHGMLNLAPRHVAAIATGKSASLNHRLSFRNGSRLSGAIADKKLAITVKFDNSKKITLTPSQIASIHFAPKETPDPTLTRVESLDGDELFGSLTDANFKLVSEFGVLNISFSQIKTVDFKGDTALVETWNGSTVKCRLGSKDIGFEIAPGARLKMQVAKLAWIVRAQRLAPAAARAKIEKLLAQLGSESYKDREAAVKALLKLGPNINPILRKHRKNPDPEVRQRIDDILEKLSNIPDFGTTKPSMRPSSVDLKGADIRRFAPVVQRDGCIF